MTAVPIHSAAASTSAAARSGATWISTSRRASSLRSWARTASGSRPSSRRSSGSCRWRRARSTVLGRKAGVANHDIGYLPQRRSFDPSLRIRGVDIVGLGLDGDRFGISLPTRARRRERHGPRRRVGRTRRRRGYARRPIGECSGGEQQRFLIAQALARRPPLLLLDEPLDSLDLPNQTSVASLGRRDLPRAAGDRDDRRSRREPDPRRISTGSCTSGPVARSRGPPRRCDHDRDAFPPLSESPIEVLARVRRPARGRRSARGRGLPPRSASPSRVGSSCCSLTAEPSLTWNLATDFTQLFEFHFMVNAFRAGIARRRRRRDRRLVHGAAPPDVCRPHPRRSSAFPGAAAAIWLGVERDPRLLRLLHRRRVRDRRACPAHRGGASSSEEAAVIGTVQAFALACRVLVRQPLRRLARRSHGACCSAASSASRRAGRDARGRAPSSWSRCWQSCASRCCSLG